MRMSFRLPATSVTLPWDTLQKDHHLSISSSWFTHSRTLSSAWMKNWYTPS